MAIPVGKGSASAVRLEGGFLPAERYPRLQLGVKVFLGLAIAYCLYALFDEPASAVAGASVITIAAMMPAYLWSIGHGAGLPIVPLHAMTFVWTFALPLVSGHPEIANYDGDEIAWAAAVVVMYILIISAIWLLMTQGQRVIRRQFYVLPKDRGYLLMVLALAFSGVFILLVVGHSFTLDAGLFGIVRAVFLAFSSVASFVLAFRLGRNELTPIQKWGFIGAAALYLAAQLSTLFLVGPVICIASLTIGYAVGRRSVPWVMIIVAACIFGVLHSGKGQIREQYWDPEPQAIAWYAIPGFLASWIVSGVNTASQPDEFGVPQPIYERISLMHLLLLVQRASPQSLPYLGGETYAPIPRLLVPRIFDPDKPASHAGTSMLSMHYGFQSDQDTATTTIGWGLLNESYANFGAWGVAGLGIFMGLLLGLGSRITIGAPVMSLENLVGVTFAAIAIQTEFTMGVFSTVLFQSIIALMIVLPFLERRTADSPG